MGKKTKSNTLGRSLIKDRYSQNRKKKTVDIDNSMLHTTEVQDGYDWGRLNLQSITEESSFHEFLRTAELAGTEFQAEKLNIKFINPKSNVGILSIVEREQLIKKHIDKKDMLKIPRRPKWTKETTAQELELNENKNFLEWRRNLALLHETNEDGVGETGNSLILTPYEKNLSYWRQLWRVLERSDVIVQIVDARNPLLFRSEDLEKYVKEINSNKLNMILINKADFLTEEQRKIWVQYFNKQNMKIAFFSATTVPETISENKNEYDKGDGNNSDSNEKNDDEVNNEKIETIIDKNKVTKSTAVAEHIKNTYVELTKSIDKTERQLIGFENKLKLSTSDDHLINSSKILTRSELIKLFKEIYPKTENTTDNANNDDKEILQKKLTTIGLVGYPNVGKSSTINALMIEKKVSVSTTPGKTKHFQTLYLDTDLMLCDCPGLVMPSFVFTKADMILNGILSIDQMRDHVPAVNLLCTEIPRHILEDKYGIIIAKPLEGEDPHRPPYSEEFLLAYGYNRGFMTANGQPDQARAARYILKDYVAGKLLYCHAPPSVKQEEFHRYPERSRPEISENKLPLQRQRAMHINRTQTTAEIDDKFFEEKKNIIHIKGKSNFPHIRAGSLAASTSAAAASGSSQSVTPSGSQQSLPFLIEKPWRHQKKERREKLRNKFAHLDQH